MLDYTATDGTVVRAHDWGEPLGSPVVLQHGFVVNTDLNWVKTGVVKTLLSQGRWVIGVDARGHGRSDPSPSGNYGESLMADDLRNLLTKHGVSAFDLVGYSMGAIVALLVAAGDVRVRRLVVGGIGEGLIEQGGVDTSQLDPSAIEHAMADNATVHTADPHAWEFRELAEAAGSDRMALAAHSRQVHRAGVDLTAVKAPTLVIAGTEDRLALRPERLVAEIPDARLSLLDGEHADVPLQPQFSQLISDFLS